MARRFVSIWFRHLTTDWFALQQPSLRDHPFVLRTLSHGRMIITAANISALSKGIQPGMVLADARAIIPELKVLDDLPDLPERLLRKLAEWCIRFTPAAAVDLPDGILLDVTGCSHLWGGDSHYLREIISRLTARGYDVRAAMADTIGCAWAAARFCSESIVVENGGQRDLLFEMPPEALRFDVETVVRLRKLGLLRIKQIADIARSSLRRRFGEAINTRLAQALGNAEEAMQLVVLPVEYEERLPCLEPIVTATGIEIALDQLLMSICLRLRNDQKGLRSAVLKCYRIDGKVEHCSIDTNSPSHSVRHLYKLFATKLPLIEPALGIELFVLEAPIVEGHASKQEKLWLKSGGLEDVRLSELIDRLTSRARNVAVRRYLPDEHYWPERSIRPALSLIEEPSTQWRTDKLRPVQLLVDPIPIEVAAPIPDYPPMLFRHKDEVHNIVKADGPERIEQEWWLQQGQHRDYYRVEDEEGRRYWIFRLGHYDDKSYRWFLHGYFA